ncbi:hypothetical protein LCGC14_0392620 [marine sediment metagenome]|uniref:Uncharacterized protein n=1 Tax=marine sediment metagenome TaxID=412755 RepID=A0A0F9VKZ4_9ZZZZ
MKNKLDEDQVQVVADTVKTIAEHRGYMTYPKEAEVRMVLEAILLIHKISKVLQSLDKGMEHGTVVRRKSGTKSRTSKT